MEPNTHIKKHDDKSEKQEEDSKASAPPAASATPPGDPIPPGDPPLTNGLVWTLRADEDLSAADDGSSMLLSSIHSQGSDGSD